MNIKRKQVMEGKTRTFPPRGLKGNVDVHWQRSVEVRVALAEHESL
jgi:hypothetical protein